MPDVRGISQALGIEADVTRDGDARWWQREADPSVAERARGLGLVEARRLHQMRRPLPADGAPDLPVRAFRPGLDDDEWLRVNNRAFAWHPDQSEWTLDTLRVRMAEPWFEASGFLLHDAPDGTIAGFCWTKFHDRAAPPMGEIYVIGVDPDHQGRGLGRLLTLSGLAWQWSHHRPPVGMLYVEHDNVGAVGLYERLGFTVHHDEVAYGLPPGSPS